jgi:hypothetical protein
MRELEPIMRYRMDRVESTAYKIALLWQDECRREIPKEPYARLATNSDPRKSMLFKYCFKLAKETSGILADRDVHLYIRAQIQVLKSINDGKVHALIEPHCLVGDKAWKRWKIWKARYDKAMSKPLPSPSAPIAPSEGKAKSDLSSSLDFLKKRGCDEADAFKEKAGEVRAWIESGEVSRFYAVLSPWVRNFVGDASSMEFDHQYYRASVTPEIERFFREKFDHEFRREKEACRGV